MKLSEFIAEIESSLSNYAQDIDKTSIKLNVIQQLKIFGRNIAIIKEKVLHIENSRTDLPEEFKSLRLALKLNPIGCEYKGNREELEGSYIYRQRIENPMYFDEVNQEYVKTCCQKIVTETIKVGDSPLKMYYDQQWLSLVQGIQKDSIDAECLNLHPAIRNSYPNEISINNLSLNTNFSKGDIYIQYYSLPVDEDGEIIIPEYTTGDIYRYIEQYVKVKIAEDLIVNNKNPMGIGQLYASWKQELPYLKSAALKEAKFASLPKNWGKKFKSLNQKNTSIFALPNLNF